MADDTLLSKLITTETKDAILQKLLDIADGLGLKTETWSSGDPTRSFFHALAARLGDTWEPGLAKMVKGGFLGLAEGDWLTLLLKYNFGVTRVTGTYASCTVRLTNSSTATIGAIAVGAVTVRNPTTKATYRNTTSGTLGPGPAATLDLTFVAEVAGSGGSAGVGDINQLVNAIAGVTVSNTTVAVGTDAESDPDAALRGQEKLAARSPNGPKEAYAYVCKTPELQADGSGLTNVTRVRVVEDSDNGIVTVYIAGAAGALAAADATKATDTVNRWARPLCVKLATGAVQNATNVVQAITYQLWVYSTISKTDAEIKTAVQAAVTAALATKAIGGDVIPPATSGFLYLEWIRAQILQAVAPFGFQCLVTTPAADVALAINQVVTAGTFTGAVTQVSP